MRRDYFTLWNLLSFGLPTLSAGTESQTVLWTKQGVEIQDSFESYQLSRMAVTEHNTQEAPL
jgi:hypothetical protein